MLLILAGWSVSSPPACPFPTRLEMGGAEVSNDMFKSGDPVMEDQKHWLFDRGQFKSITIIRICMVNFE